MTIESLNLLAKTPEEDRVAAAVEGGNDNALPSAVIVKGINVLVDMKPLSCLAWRDGMDQNWVHRLPYRLGIVVTRHECVKIEVNFVSLLGNRCLPACEQPSYFS
ncbi:Uncharacterized protein Fot_42974 [Forsythia ovata]|uniref:Uncharacterized protein n=1 Tax=Forsythia ovata TaxID=205694 RepID=A0ABD1RPA8_9LAMI